MRLRFSHSSPVLAVGLSLLVAVGPAAQSAAAQQATPTATPRPATATPMPTIALAPGQTISLTVVTTPAPFLGATPLPGSTPLPIQSSAPTSIGPMRTCSAVSGPTHIFQVCPSGSVISAELALEQWAVQADLQLTQLPASAADQIMASDRAGLRGLILARLEAATKKSASAQTSEEQALLGFLSSEVQVFKVGVAQEAKREYQQWQQNPFCFAPPAAAQAAAGGYNPCQPNPTPQERLQPPPPPSHEQFQAWGNAVEMSLLNQPVDDATVGDMGLRAKLAYGLVGSTTPGSLLAGLAGVAAPQSWFRKSAPFRYQAYFSKGRIQPSSAGKYSMAKGAPRQVAEQAVQSEATEAGNDAAAAANAETGTGVAAEDSATAYADAAVSATEASVETAEASGAAADAVAATASTVSSTAGSAGGILFAGPAAVILLALTAAITAGMEAVTADNLPKQLDDDIANAQAAPDLGGKDNDKFQVFLALMMSPDFPSTDPGPPPSSDDLQWVFSAQGPTTVLHYLAPDGLFHTARATSDGWFVDGVDGGPMRRQLTINVVDKYLQVWSVTRSGKQLLVERAEDANPADIQTTSSINYLDWDPTDQSQEVARHAILVHPGQAAPLVPRPDLAGQRLMGPNEDVYLVDSDGTKAHVPDPGTYGNLFRDWNNMTHVDQATLDAIPEWDTLSGGAFLGRQGEGDDRIWLVSDNRRRWVNSQAAMDQFYFAYNTIRGIEAAQDCSSLAATGHCTPEGMLLPEAAPIELAGWPLPAAPWILNDQQANIGGHNPGHFYLANGGFTITDGGATDISVGPDGQPWLVNAQGAIFRRSRGSTDYVHGSWQTMPGQPAPSRSAPMATCGPSARPVTWPTWVAATSTTTTPPATAGTRWMVGPWRWRSRLTASPGSSTNRAPSSVARRARRATWMATGKR